MLEQLLDAIAAYPYIGVALAFVLCGLGFPLPEEIVLLVGGYVCARYPDKATLGWMMVWCAGSIVAGDLLPFVLGRIFGVRLLRLRWLRYFVTKQRLAKFDRWFRRRGDAVIFIARFLAGIRVVAFFTAGTMKMRWTRFLLLDGLGIVLIVPSLTLLGFHGASFFEQMVENVQRVERGILWASIAGGALLALWIWLWRRRRARALAGPTETFVQPTEPVREEDAPAVPRAAAEAEVEVEAAPGGTDNEAEPPAAPGGPPAGPAPGPS